MAIQALPLLVVILLLLALQAFGSPFNAARAATLPAVLPGDHYVLGKAANDMVVQFSQVLGFGAGGVVVVAVGTSGGLLLDSATFLLSAALIAFGVRRRPAPTRGTNEPSNSYFKDLTAGFSLVARTPQLRTLVLLATIAGFYVTVEGLAVPYAHEIGGGTEAAGLLLAASPAGAVAGMWLITLLPPERRMGLLAPLAILACVPLIFCFFAPGLLPTVALWALSGLASAFLWHRLTPGGLGLEFTGLVSALAVGLYALIAYAVVLSDDPGPTGMDQIAYDAAFDLATGWLTDAVRVVTDLGSLAVVLPVAFVAGVALAVARRWVELAVLVAALGITVLGVSELKGTVDRPRPPNALDDAGGSSFPSGHAAYSVIYAWLAITVVARLRAGITRGTAVIVIGITITALVGLSRVYLGVHYLSDVVSGWGLGVSAFAGCAAVAVASGHLRQNARDVAPGEDRP